MSPFKKAAVKGGSSKGKEPVIDVDDYPPQTKETRSSSKRFDPNKFRSYAAYQSHENYFQNATPLLERTVDQSSLHDTDIPKWFAHKDWNYLLSDLDDAYEDLVKEFYANAIVEEDELKCWVRKKSFSVSPAYLVESFASTDQYSDIHRFMMIFVLMRSFSKKVLVKTWSSHPMANPSVFPLFLQN